MADLHLVDATYELFRANFGAPPKTAPDGREIGAVRGLIASLIFLLRGEKATHVACATDHVIRSFRNDLWPTYKTDEGIDPALYAQFGLAEEAMAALGLVVWPMIEFEADDALATGVAKYGSSFERVLICTVDKDLAQCVSEERIILVDRRRKTTMGERGVIEKFGVKPQQIPDFLALVGDAADGYPGLSGFGPKSAAVLLGAFKSLEAIPLAPAAWPKLRGAPGLAETLRARRDDAIRMKEVATLRSDVPLQESAGDLEWRGATPAFRDFAERFGLSELCDRVPVWRS